MRNLVIFLFALTSCVEARIRDFDPDLCHESRAYEAGYNDGTEGRPMESSFLERCRPDLRDPSYKGYREGYDKGKKEYEVKMAEFRKSQMAPPPPPMPPPAQPGSGTLINVNIGGNQNVGPANQTNPRAYYCEVKAFTMTFSGWGPTQLEATRTAIANCTAKYHQMHCDAVSCSQNR